MERPIARLAAKLTKQCPISGTDEYANILGTQRERGERLRHHPFDALWPCMQLAADDRARNTRDQAEHRRAQLLSLLLQGILDAGDQRRKTICRIFDDGPPGIETIGTSLGVPLL